MNATHPLGVLWDMDGTIVDTAEVHFQTWFTVLDEKKIAITRESLQAVFGKHSTSVLSAHLGCEPDTELVKEVIDRKELLFREAVQEGQVALFSGVQYWLQTLHDRDVPQAIASSAPMENITAIMEQFNLEPFFGALVAGADMPPKPAPDVFLSAARQLHLAPEHCVVIEDAVAGVQAARRGGMRCIAVATTHPAERLLEADLVVERLSDLPEDIFETLQNRH